MEILENSTYKCHKELCVKFPATSSTAHKCTFFSNFRLSFFFLQLKRSVMVIPNNIEAEKKLTKTLQWFHNTHFTHSCNNEFLAMKEKKMEKTLVPHWFLLPL